MSIDKLKNFITSKLSNELPKTLSYHNLSHTLYVFEEVNGYIYRLKIGDHDALLLRTAALLHDIGFIWVYSNHEERGVQFAEDELPKWGYSENDIKIISGMIMSTKIPQSPKTLLEEIICDSDLGYLGTDTFYTTSQCLFKEFLEYKILKKPEDWDQVQIDFLKSHTFQTEYAKGHRDPLKQKYLSELIKKNNS
jgi:HD superfamily phosphodiesterase